MQKIQNREGFVPYSVFTKHFEGQINFNPLSTDVLASRRLKVGLRTQRAISQQLQALRPR